MNSFPAAGYRLRTVHHPMVCIRTQNMAGYVVAGYVVAGYVVAGVVTDLLKGFHSLRFLRFGCEDELFSKHGCHAGHDLSLV